MSSDELMPPCTKMTSSTTTSFPSLLPTHMCTHAAARQCQASHSQGNTGVVGSAQHPNVPWPVVSPDMAPIEHVWDGIGRHLQTRGHHENLPALEAALVYEWNTLPQAFFQRLVVSMRRHTACLNARGGHTRH